MPMRFPAGINPVCMMGTFSDKWAEWLEGMGCDIPNPNWKLYTNKRGFEYEPGGDGPAPLSIPKEHHDTRFMVHQVKALSFENIDPEKFKQLLATHIYGEAHLLSAVPLYNQISKSV